MPASIGRKARRAFDRAASAVAIGLGGEMGPLQREKAEHRTREPYWCRQPNGRTRIRSYVCPAKQYATHPDAKLRALAQAQADAMHAFNDYAIHGVVHKGKCWAKACRNIDPWTPGFEAQLAAQAMGTQKAGII